MQSGQWRLGWGAVYAFALVASLLAPACGQAAAPETDHLRLKHIALRLADHAPLRIIAFGSSSTEGIGASSPAASYPSRLEAELRAALPSGEPVTVLNRGVGGEDADDMARRLPQVIAEHPDLIIWQTGSNDPLRAVPLDRFVQETIAGLQQIRAAHIDVMLMGPQLCRALDGKPSTVRYRDALHAIGEGLDVPVIRRHELMRRWLADRLVTPAQMFAPDGLHMADGGYAALARAVAADILHRVESPRLAMDTLQGN